MAEWTVLQTFLGRESISVAKGGLYNSKGGKKRSSLCCDFCNGKKQQDWPFLFEEAADAVLSRRERGKSKLYGEKKLGRFFGCIISVHEEEGRLFEGYNGLTKGERPTCIGCRKGGEKLGFPRSRIAMN